MRIPFAPPTLGDIIANMDTKYHQINPRYRDLLAPTPADVLFDPNRIIEIVIEMSESNWDSLRHQTRTVLDVLMPPSCMSGPFPRPFTYFPANVTIDGHTLRNVGVRKKGFLGSLSEEKPAIKLRLNKYVCEQHLLGKKSFTLNNALQDPSYIRQAIAYRLFANAELPTPRCNFAHVTVNGRDLGLYVHVESINKQFLRRHYVDVRGNLYEGIISDFRPRWINTFQAKTNRRTTDRSDLWELTAALTAPDPTMLSEVAARVDLDYFYTYWAMEVLLNHRDGYAAFSNNFYLYRDPVSDRFYFLPWGIDNALHANQYPSQQQPQSVFACGILARRLYLFPQSSSSYLNKLQQLLNSVWDEKSIIAEIDRIAALITPIVDPSGSAGLNAQIDDVRSFVLGRRQAITSELAGGAPQWNEPLPDPPCLQLIGDLTITFATTWGTTTADPFISGTGVLQLTLNDTAAQPTQVGARSGPETQAFGGTWCTLNILGQLPDNTYAVVLCQIHPSRFASGQVLQSDWRYLFGSVFIFDPVTNTAALAATFGVGSLTLLNAGMQPNASVNGTLAVQLVR